MSPGAITGPQRWLQKRTAVLDTGSQQRTSGTPAREPHTRHRDEGWDLVRQLPVLLTQNGPSTGSV